MRKALGYFIAFCVIFIFLQFQPLSESAFARYTHWDVLLFALVCARGSLFADISVTGCAEITDITVAVALGEIAGDALFVGFILLIFYLVQLGKFMSIKLSSDNKEKLHDWMYTLLYPAVLGTMLVSLLFGWFEDRINLDYKLGFALFLIFYFSSQHVENTSEKGDYTGWEFISDFIELLLMIPLFYLLGVYVPDTEAKIFSGNEWVIFYVLLSISFAMPVIARMLSNKFTFSINSKGLWLSGLSTIAVGLCVAGLVWNTSSIILSALYLVFVIYLFGFVFEGGKTKVYERPT